MCSRGALRQLRKGALYRVGAGMRAGLAEDGSGTGTGSGQQGGQVENERQAGGVGGRRSAGLDRSTFLDCASGESQSAEARMENLPESLVRGNRTTPVAEQGVVAGPARPWTFVTLARAWLGGCQWLLSHAALTGRH